jgi:PAS domain S-box-containing protein
MNSRRIRALLVEDNPVDAELVLRELRRAGFDLEANLVDTESEFLNHLHAELDVILSDYAMPQFSGLRALELVNERGLDVPFILISATIGEEMAVAAMKLGAADYLLKDRLGRLGQAVEQALERKRIRDERKRAEEELRITHQQLRHLLAHSPAVIYTLQIDGQNVAPVVVSENVERLLGSSMAESTRYEWWLNSLHPEDRERVLDGLAHGLTKGGFYMEYRVRHKDGSYHWIEDINRIVCDPNGRPKEAVGVWTDVTERKRVEERLREQADMIDRAHDAIIVRDFASDRVTVWNKGAERVYGWSANEALGKPMAEIFVGEANDYAAFREQLLSTGEFHGEVKHRAKDGREVIVDARVTLVRNDDGAPRAILGINNDITEQKKLETQLLRAQRLETIGTLASGVAHDLNNILTPILVASQLLHEKVIDEHASKNVSLIEESARRGASVVKQVLTFARGIEGERVVINPRDLIDEMVDIANKTFPKSIAITARYEEDLWTIRGDPTQLHQVLLNLFVNARDAMPHGGSVIIAAENVDIDKGYAAISPEAKVGRHVLLCITDTGSGMSRSTIEKIFDPFFTTKQPGKGTGLGLSTTLGIVKSHAGFLSVSSDPGRGTAFKIFLPAADTESSPAKTVARQQIQGNNELVLLVDDEESVRRVTRMTLENNNYRVIESSDGPQALTIFAPQMDSIDLVLTDIMLPRMDGITLIRAIKKMKSGIVCIASSGQGDDGRLSELQNLGVADVLPKPYDGTRLLQTVHKAMSAART